MPADNERLAVICEQRSGTPTTKYERRTIE